MSAPPFEVVTVYIEAGVVLCVAFQRTILQRHQPLSQRNQQLTDTAHPQTNTATAGESLDAMHGQVFSIQCGMQLGEHPWATLTGCWTEHLREEGALAWALTIGSGHIPVRMRLGTCNRDLDRPLRWSHLVLTQNIIPQDLYKVWTLIQANRGLY